MTRLAPILQRRSPVVHLCAPEQTVAEAVSIMAAERIGVVPVTSANRLVGIFSERDLLRRVLALGKDPEKTLLEEVMTPEPVTASPAEDRQSAIQKMQSVGCRHLPIVVNDAVIDMLSMRDLLAVELEDREAEIEQLRGYIHGNY